MIIEIGVFRKFVKKESFLKFNFFIHFIFENLNITGLNNDLVLVYFKGLIPLIVKFKNENKLISFIIN